MPVSPVGIPLAVTHEVNAVRTSPPGGVRLVDVDVHDVNGDRIGVYHR